MLTTKKLAVVLVSGGLDSATILAIARRQGYELYAITFDYGQRHRIEMQAAKRVCDAGGVVKQIVFPLDFRSFGGSALTSDLPVPKNRSDAEMNADIPITYVPARNTVFLSIALGWAEVLGADDLFVGVNAVDYSGYPDCRPEFIAAFITLANLATKTGVEQDQPFHVHTPLISLSKAEIIRKGVELGVDYSLTHSCYDPDAQGRACGRCDSCQLRLKGFAEAGMVDPVPYVRKT
ncbi:MAG: 7-cyano-7-deazaguanine synthase QueC [Planctomycetaceae bacterium]